MNFNEWVTLEEGITGYIISTAKRICEGRKDPKKLQSRNYRVDPKLFDLGKPDVIEPPHPSDCPITPLSGYETHVKSIQKFAFQSPENFAQTLIFSPLSGNVAFAKHWDNFQVLMFILRNKFPNKVDKQELEYIIDAFNDKYHNLAHTIASWKFDTVVDVWNNREELFNKLPQISKEGDMFKLISELSKIKGVQPIKAGFIAQLLFGQAGCIDTHNIDIYTKAFPELSDKLNLKLWQGNKTGVQRYVDVLKDLEERGVGTKELWDIWVDFVEHFYLLISSHGKGAYSNFGPSLNVDEKEVYQFLKDIKIPKKAIGRSGQTGVMVPAVSGKHGFAASATHLQDTPENMLKQFDKIYNKGEPGTAGATSVPFRKTLSGEPLEKTVGLGLKPSLLHYFGDTLDDQGNIDKEKIDWIIKNKLSKGGKKAAKNNYRRIQGNLF